MSDYGQGYGRPSDHGEPYDPHPGRDYQPTERVAEAPPPSNRRILTVLGGVIVVCVVLLVLALLGVFDFRDTTSGSPRAAATALLEAGRTHDVDAARKVLCDKDLSSGTAGSVAAMRIQTFSIDAIVQSAGTATVTATITNGGANVVVPLPVIKENGAWKVCLPAGATLGPTGTPTASGSSSSTGGGSASAPPSSPVPSVSVPTDITNFNLCQSATSAQEAAQVFISAIALGSADLAKACVFDHAVPDATIDAVAASDTVFSQVSASGSTFTFQSSDGSKKLVVTVAQESDGKFYVTALVQG